MYRLHCWLSCSRSYYTAKKSFGNNSPPGWSRCERNQTNGGNFWKHAPFWIRQSPRKDTEMIFFFSPVRLILMWSHTEHNQSKINVTPAFDLCAHSVSGVHSWDILHKQTGNIKDSFLTEVQHLARLQITFKNNFNVTLQLHYVWNRHSLFMLELLKKIQFPSLVSPVMCWLVD